MTILPKPVSRRKKITRKKHYWKNCQVSENSLLTRNYLPKWPSGQDIKIGIDWVFFLHAKVIVV
jgi:hypothetical protein